MEKFKITNKSSYMDEKINPWKTISTTLKYENPWIRVEEHQVLNPSGKEGIYGTVHFKNIAIGIIPVDDEGNTWLVGQYRYPLNCYSWEIIERGRQNWCRSAGICPTRTSGRNRHYSRKLGIAHYITYQ
jgi:hypothetical protein